MNDFANVGEQLQAILLAGRRIGAYDRRLSVSAGPSGLNEDVPSEGGILLRDQFATEILARTYATGEIASRVTRRTLQVGSRVMKLPTIDEVNRNSGSRFGGISSVWLRTADPVDPSSPKWMTLEPFAKPVAALGYTSNELLNDAPLLSSFFANVIAPLELAFKLEESIVGGTGAGQPLGILNSTAKIRVSKESGQADNTIIEKNVASMWSRLWAPSRKNAVWLVTEDAGDQLDAIPGGPNAVHYAQPGIGGEAPFPLLKGRPVIPVEYCPVLGTEGDIILADLTQYLVIDKGAVQAKVSPHVKFTTDETGLMFTFYADGQPLWSSPVTPRNGAQTRSPFVTLETRQ